MKSISLTTIVMCFSMVCLSAHGQKDKSMLDFSENYDWTSWGNNRLPKECRLPLSKDFGGISFTGRYASYTKADTWYITLATDGTMYSCYTDGSVNGEGAFSPKPRSARIVGTDPLDLQVSAVGKLIDHNGNDKIAGRFGRYPCAQLMYNDIWYYGTYLLEQNDRSVYVPNFDWPILQPFVGFRVSDDFGESWFDHTTPEDPLLENFHDKWIDAHGVDFNPYEVMIGAPHFVDFGQNLKHAPVDEATGRKWAYMVAHGADAQCELAHNSWVSGDNIYLLRILMPEGRDKEENFRYMNNPANWQYLSRDGSYRPWNRDNLREVYSNICPIVSAKGFMGNVGLTYDAPLGRFIMTLSRVSDDDRNRFNTLILESDAIDGKYRVVQYLKDFATQSYFMNIPSSFISSDGRTMWLCYSSNYGYKSSPLPTIGGSRYAMCLREIKLDGKGEAKAHKYEAEGMELTGHAALKVDSLLSNGAGVAEIARLGDGVEFYSKSSGSTLTVATFAGTTDTKSMSIYINDRFAGNLILKPSAGESGPALHRADVKIRRGDKVSLRIEAGDISVNRLAKELPGNEHHFIGCIDYVLVE